MGHPTEHCKTDHVFLTNQVRLMCLILKESTVALWLMQLKQGELCSKGMCLIYLLQAYLPSETLGPQYYKEGKPVNLRRDRIGELKEA